jgi:hypothetical protein
MKYFGDYRGRRWLPVIDRIYRELRREQNKLRKMTLGAPETYRQSLVVDRLVVEYYRAMEECERRKVG